MFTVLWKDVNFGWAASASITPWDSLGTATPPDTSVDTLDMDSKVILRRTVELIAAEGWHVVNIDATVCAEQPKINPHVGAMKACMAQVIGCTDDCISIKATTTERLGFTGREEGMSAYAVCLIAK